MVLRTGVSCKGRDGALRAFRTMPTMRSVRAHAFGSRGGCGGKATGKRDEGRVGGGVGNFLPVVRGLRDRGAAAGFRFAGCPAVGAADGFRFADCARRPARPSERAAAAACEPNWLVWERLSRGVPADGAVFASMAALLVELLVECERRAQDGMGPCAVRRCEREAMDSFFKISERGSSVSAEVVGGIHHLFGHGLRCCRQLEHDGRCRHSLFAALTSTCLGAAVATVAMGLIANRPIALASGMG